MNWYAIRARGAQERTAAVTLIECGFTVFLPMGAYWRGSPRVKHHEPLMPGYVFVRCEPEDFADIHGLEGIQGFVRYYREDGAMWPIPLPDREILKVQVEERAGVYDYTRDKRVRYRPRKGEMVKITAGPYLGFIAKVLATPRGDRAKLLVEGFDAPRNRTEDIRYLTEAA